MDDKELTDFHRTTRPILLVIIIILIIGTYFCIAYLPKYGIITAIILSVAGMLLSFRAQRDVKNFNTKKRLTYKIKSKDDNVN